MKNCGGLETQPVGGFSVPDSQAEHEGSIPFTCSKSKPEVAVGVRPGVYKMPMVRMNENSDEYPNVRVYIFRKSKRLLSNLLVCGVK